MFEALAPRVAGTMCGQELTQQPAHRDHQLKPDGQWWYSRNKDHKLAGARVGMQASSNERRRNWALHFTVQRHNEVENCEDVGSGQSRTKVDVWPGLDSRTTNANTTSSSGSGGGGRAH